MNILTVRSSELVLSLNGIVLSRNLCCKQSSAFRRTSFSIFSSGSPESGADSAETRGEFVDKLTKARSAVPPGSPLNPIFTLPNSSKSVCRLVIPVQILQHFVKLMMISEIGKSGSSF